MGVEAYLEPQLDIPEAGRLVFMLADMMAGYFVYLPLLVTDEPELGSIDDIEYVAKGSMFDPLVARIFLDSDSL